MIDTGTLAVFVVATLALLLVPGPAVLYIIARGIEQGRLAAVISAVGIGCGSLVHVTAAALGLSAILLSSAVAFSLVKYVGAAYLVILGIRTLLTHEAGTVAGDEAPRSRRRLFAQGFVIQVLNPKLALFFFAFLPQFVDPARGSVAIQTLMLGGILVGMGTCTDSAYALVAGSAGAWLKHHTGFIRARRYVAGAVYLGLGVTTAFIGSERGS